MAKILITGSSSGIGKAITLEFLKERNQVIGISRNQITELSEYQNYQHYSLDLSQSNNIEKHCKEIAKQHPDINVVILNAGIGIFKEIDQISANEIIKLMNVNVISQMIISKTFVNNLRNVDNAKIIIIGSEAGLSGSKKSSLYSASKFALRGFALSLQKDLSNSQIQVNLLNPGAITTEFYDDLDFTPGEDQNNSIDKKQMVDLVSFITKQKNNFYFEEINLKPIQRVFNKTKK